MRASLTTLILAVAVAVPAARAEVVLEHVGRYNTQIAWHDHLMTVETIGDHHAVVGSNLDMVIVDLDTLPPGAGTQTYLHRLPGLDVSNIVVGADGVLYVNLRRGGFAVVQYDELPTPTLTLVDTIAEPGVYSEKMTLAGDRLYVPVHAYGLRIYDVTTPDQPVLIGSLEDGLDDAFSVAVDGDIAYVADGAGGLKIVDVADPTDPVVTSGEDPTSAAATAEDVLVTGGDVYVACGGAGVALYPGGALGGRTLYDTPTAAKQLARMGDYLLVADIGGIAVYAIAPDGTLTHAARERGQRRSAGGTDVTLRLWEGVAPWGGDRILAANWDSMDVYRIVDAATGTQPDVTVSTQRIRFEPAGGSVVVQVRNDGAAPLGISSIVSTEPTFSASPTSGLLQPGDTLDVQVSYAGGAPGSALLRIVSNDPDESPLPIEVFGETSYLDPGEPAASFTLQSWTYDHDAETFESGMFDLDDHVGQVVFMHVFGLG